MPGEPDPVIVTLYVPAVVDASVQDAVTVALAVMLVAVVGQVTVRPVAGVTEADRLILPTKFWTLVRVTVMAAPVAPLLKLTGEDTEIVKSPTWTVELAELDAVPGEPEPVINTE